MSLLQLGLQDIRQQLDKKELTATDLVDESFRVIQAVDEKVQAFLTLDEDRARTRAAELDQQLQNGQSRGPLFGLPVGLKDNIMTEGLRTTCASKHLENFMPIYDATVVEHLHSGQAVIVGKHNMDEFAMGGSSETSAFKKTYNPWNHGHIPGGSSGGSAASVAAGEVYFALGSDTGGSIRQPASYCGVVGLKPTYGRVSRYGLAAFASSLDQVGTITKNVEDAAYVLQAIAGHDALDSTSADVEVPDYSAFLTGEVRNLRIGVPREYLGDGIQPAVKEAVMNALKLFEQLGATWEEVSLPHTSYAIAAYYLLGSSEASTNMARLDGVRYGARAEDADDLLELYHKSRSQGFGPEVKRRIMLGTYALSSGYYDAYYVKAQKVRTLIKQDFDQVFEKYDLLLGPTVPTTAFKIGELLADPLTMYMNDILTVPASLAGVPAISIPCGMSDGLPIGMQLIGKAFAESTILRAAHTFEQHTEFHKARPEL